MPGERVKNQGGAPVRTRETALARKMRCPLRMRAPSSLIGALLLLIPVSFLSMSCAKVQSHFIVPNMTLKVIDYAIQEPWLFAMNLGRKALFVLGFHEPYAPGWGYSPVYILAWTTAIAGICLVLRQAQGSRWTLLIPAIISLTQFIAIVIVYPKGERLIVPVHILLLPYCAAAVWFAVNRRSSEDANASLMPNRTST